MQKIIVHNAADRLALKYKDYFKEVFNSVRKVRFSKKQLFIHSDFDSSNVLFRKGKLIGIIDFDDTAYFPRIFDISVSIRDSCYTKSGKIDIKKIKIFMKEYEKVSKLSKEEKDMIIPVILRANVDFFVWAYVWMKKERENRKKYMQEMVNSTKDIMKNKKKIHETIFSSTSL
jgi:Ser/Thr protein kinase RdoA (MazF antagonist)